MDIHGHPSQRWEHARPSETAVWQPLMLITPERLECRCGARAVFLLTAIDADGNICDGMAYCQPCFQRAQDEED